jgi:predicted O-methyltransferase YrrM
MSLRKKSGIDSVFIELNKIGIENFLTVGDVHLLYNAASSLPDYSTILEIGTNSGRSTRIMAMAAPTSTIITIDIIDMWSGEWIDNVIRIIGKSEVIIPIIKTKYDMVFIDGLHDKGSVEKDIYNCEPKLKSSGLFVFHDYTGDHKAVSDVVNEFVEANNNYERIHIPSGDKYTTCYAARKI